MRLHQAWIAVVILAATSLACGSTARELPISEPATAKIAAPSPTPDPRSVLVDVYDPARDPAEDLKTAIGMAQADDKRILLEVGGDWCVWCRIMDDFYTDHPELITLRDENYILVKVNWSEENENTAFLSQYPDIPGYPHIFVLDSDGTLIQSQNTAELEEGESYNLEKFRAFLEKWAG